MQPSRHFVHLFSPDALQTLFPIYSKIPLIVQTIARMPEPRAREPSWYLKDHHIPFQTSESPGMPSASGTSFLLKYHVALETIMTNSFMAIINALIQIIPKNIPAIIQLVPSDLSAVLVWYSGFIATTPLGEIEATPARPQIQKINTPTHTQKQMSGIMTILLVSEKNYAAVSITAIEILSDFQLQAISKQKRPAKIQQIAAIHIDHSFQFPLLAEALLNA